MNTKGNINKVILVGHLGQTPELRHTPKGNPVLTLSLATNREFKDAEGAKQKETTWHRATVWGKQAETCAKFLTTGSRIYVEGELRMKSWNDKEGVARKTAEINVDKVTFLGKAPEKGEPAAAEFSPDAMAM